MILAISSVLAGCNLFSGVKEAPKPKGAEVISEGGEGVFEGAVMVKNEGCYVDGKCSLVVK